MLEEENLELHVRDGGGRSCFNRGPGPSRSPNPLKEGQEWTAGDWAARTGVELELGTWAERAEGPGSILDTWTLPTCPWGCLAAPRQQLPPSIRRLPTAEKAAAAAAFARSRPSITRWSGVEEQKDGELG